jgi:hypothetical protein
MDLPRVDNRTDFVAEPFVLIGRDGERLVLVVKATYVRPAGESVLDPAPRRAQRRIRGADVPWGEPEKGSIKYPADLCIAKPGTDVVVVASAHAPGGEAAPWFDAGVRVGLLEKAIRVFGLRVWEADGAGLTAPRPTLGAEVRYEHAWGGLDVSDPERIVEEPRNPVGTGIARDLATLTHRPAPCIEDPANLISSVRTRPPPAGLGAIGRHWQPRRQYLGTYDAAWLQERAPLLPIDHDDRANLCASPGLTAVPPLSGGEDVALLALTPGGGSVGFRLPRIEIAVTLKTPGREPQTRCPYVDTVVIDTLHARDDADVLVELVWRVAFLPPRRLKDAEIVVTAREVP